MSEWFIDEDCIYQLQESGDYEKIDWACGRGGIQTIKGKPILENKFLITIQGKASTQEKKELTEKIHNFLQSL